MTLLSFSQSRLLKDGRWWVRLGSYGPGLHVARYCVHPNQFSLRNGLMRHLRLGEWVVSLLKAWR